MTKFLWKITIDENRVDYDVYDSAIVVAANEADARKIHPANVWPPPRGNYWCKASWADSPDEVMAQMVGVAVHDLELGTVVCSSFNAG